MLARGHLRHFMRHVWWNPGDFLQGVHTVDLAERLTLAVERFREGQSSFLVVSMPFRHGKSDMVSRALPAWFLGRCADMQPDIIMSGYGAQLVESFSRKAKSLIRSSKYQNLFPGVNVDPARAANNKWAIAGSTGEVTVAGLGGAITGAGGHLVIVDDFCKNRAEAESATYRDRVWGSFTSDVLTRRAPASIVIVCATRWHVDDIIGRIEKSMETDEAFPRFEFISYPAESQEYRTGYLFPERFTPEWYDSQRATLGPYSAAGLLDCSPHLRGGSMLKIDRVVYHDSVADMPQGMRIARGWDLASGEKKRVKDDPDYTAGALLGQTFEGGREHLWLMDMVRFQREAPERDAAIIATQQRDSERVRVGIEAQGAYKDTYVRLSREMRNVERVLATADKVVNAEPLEAIIDGGRFHVLRAPWTLDFINEASVFPSGTHDDQVDAVTVAHRVLRNRPAQVAESGALRGVGVW